MDGKLDTVREAIEGLLRAANRNVGGMAPGAIASWCYKALATLSAIDPDEIRRECARAARNAIFDFGIGNKASNYYSPIIRKELAVQLVERAILGAEPAQGGKDGCARCRNRPLPGASRALCESCKLVIGKNYDPRPVSSEPAQDEESLQETLDRLDGYGIDNECGARG